MVTVGEIYEFINQFAPFQTAMEFDNVGLLVGERSLPLTSALLALDITPEVVEEAAEKKADLIISHHPVIFTPLKSLSIKEPPYLLAHYGIAAICAHTNLDLAPGGVNSCLAERLGLTEVQMLKEYENTGLAEGLLGTLKNPMEPELFAAYVKRALGCGGLKYTRGKVPVKTVGICSGSGGDLLFDAAAKEADAFVTSDTKHHQLLAAVQLGITLVDAGHFCTEDVVIAPLLERLQVQFPSVKFEKSKKLKEPVSYL